MINGESVGLVIPCYNEEAGLRGLLSQVPAEIDDVMVVDNNSTDATAMVAAQFGVRVVHEIRPGYGQAYQAGLRHIQTDIVVTLDGDGQYPINEVPRLVRFFQDQKLEFLSACRFPLTSSSMSYTRRLGNWGLTTTTRWLFGVPIRDSQSGMWVFRRQLLERVHPRQPGMAFSEEFKVKVILAGLRFGETHIPYYERAGHSKLATFKDGWANMRYLWQLRRGSRD